MVQKFYSSNNGGQLALFRQVILDGVPDLEDIKVMAEALRVLGATVNRKKIY